MKVTGSGQYRTRLRLAWLVLVWESLLRSASPALGVALAVLAAALLELPQLLAFLLGPLAHFGLLVALAVLVLWLSRRAVQGFEVPDEAAARRRLETDSNLAHRPLTTLSEQPANRYDPRAERLWRAWQQRVAHSLPVVRLGPPRPVLSYLDPVGLRAGIGIALIVALVAARDDPVARLSAAFVPDLSGIGAAGDITVDAWIDPPAYTGRAPILLERNTQAGPLAAPVNSVFFATVNGSGAAPALRVLTDHDEVAAAFEELAPQTYRVRRQIDASAAFAIRYNGQDLASWSVNVVPDLPPSVRFARPPSATRRGSVSVFYEARDDYGLATTVLQIRLLDEDGSVGEEVLERAMPPITPGRTEHAGQGIHDLTPHPWAGRAVRMVLRASDGAGQAGRSEPEDLVLPERAFLHPIARAVIEQRRRLLLRPEDRADVSRVVLTLAGRPHAYGHDVVAFLALKSAAQRLRLVTDGTADQEVAELLWKTALRIEDGGLSNAAQRLRELERQLQEALASNASDQEIRQLVDQLREALDEYLQAMAREMARNPPQQQSSPRTGDDADGVRREDLQKMVDQIRDLAETGARSQAQQMLSRLQEMLENLHMDQRRASPEERALEQMMQQLGAMQRRQQELLDETYMQQRSQPARGDTRNPPSNEEAEFRRMTPQELAEAQRELQRSLQSIRDRLRELSQEVPSSLEQAERSMGDATRSLNREQPGSALGSQATAIEQLRRAEQALLDQLLQRSAGRQQPSGSSGPSSGTRDPLNPRRPGDGHDSESIIGIPDEPDFQKTRRIRDELHRRSGEINRPQLELDYIDRLLQRF